MGAWQRWTVRLAALFVAGVVLAVPASRALDRWLRRRAEVRLTAALGEPVHVAAARLRWPCRLELRGVATARGTAEQLLIDGAPWGDGGDGRPRHLRAASVVAAGLATATSVDLLAIAGAGWRVRAEGVERAGPVLSAAVIEAELEREPGAPPLAVDLAGGGWDGVGGIEVHASRSGSTWQVRLRWPGLTGALRLDTDDGAGSSGEGLLVLEEAALPRHPLPWLDLGAARASGRLQAAGRLDDARLDIQLEASGITLRHPALAPTPVVDVGGQLHGALRIGARGRRLESSGLEWGIGGLAVHTAGVIDRDARTAVAIDVGPTRCSELAAALRPLLPALTGLEVVGDLSARVEVAFDAGRVADLVLDSDLDIGCAVARDAPAAEPGQVALSRQLAALAGRPVRSLESLGPTVVRAMVIAEDANFFHHRGFERWTIRRALAANLEARAFVRGASTITQQLARNLYLDGSRNLSRKLEEAIIAWRLEQVVGKRELLEAWLDLIELGPDVHGVDAGARYWFGRDAAELAPEQAAALAALAPAPLRGFDDAWSRRYRDLLQRLPSDPPLPTEAPAPRRR